MFFIHFPVICPIRTINYLIDKLSIRQCYKSLRNSNINFLGSFLIWSIYRWEPTTTRFCLTLCPNLSWFIFVITIGINKVQSFCTRNSSTSFLSYLFWPCSVFNINCKLFPFTELFWQVYINFIVIVRILQYFVIKRNLMDNHCFGI